MLQHLRNPQLVATFAVGFNVLFSLVGAFSYITFYLAAPPFRMTPAQLSWLFTIYLVGLIIIPACGLLITRYGSRAALFVAVSAGAVGMLLTLIQSLWAILLGMTLFSMGVFVCQVASTTYIQRHAPPGGRATASGLYVMFYYIGGSVSGIVPGILWRFGGWKACVSLVVVVQLITLAIAGSIWKGREQLC
jgi:MFS family permease